MRQRTPEIVRETSADPRFKNWVQPSLPTAPVRRDERRARHGLADRGELAADARNRSRIRFDMQIASAEFAALSNPLLNGHV